MKLRDYFHMGVILRQPGQLRPDSSNTYGLDALVSNVNTYSMNLLPLTQGGTDITLTGPQVVSGVVQLTGSASNNFTITLPPTARLIDALGPTIALDGSFAVPISVQNEDATYTATLTAGDAKTTINGTATVAPGTRRIWLLTVGSVYDYTTCTIQNIGTFSTTGNAVGTGTVTSVGQTVPVEFNVSGSPITGTGTLAITKANEAANTIWSGPVSGGAAQPTFRALVDNDFPTKQKLTQTFITQAAEGSLANSRVIAAGTNVTITDGGPGSTLTIAATGGSVSPLTTKGDVYGFSTVNARIPVGADAQVLTADSTQTLGVKWATPSAGSGGTLQSTAFTASGTFTPGTNVTAVWLTMTGAGGGGRGTANAATPGAGGGGAGEFCQNFMVPVSGAVTVTIGAAGAAGAINGSGGNGGNTSFGSYLVLGGLGATSGNGGIGGGPRGATGGTSGNPPTDGALGTAESPVHFGGSSGGGSSSTTTVQATGYGGGAGGFLKGGAVGVSNANGGGGGGGAASLWGLGGAGGAGNGAGVAAAASAYGAGGGGGGGNNATGQVGGAGAPGYVLVSWVG